MFLIVGLGNPGKEYEHTPHNAGFAALDEFTHKNDFPEFALYKKSNSLVSEGIVEEQKMLLAKPQTFMNNSGSAVKFLYTKYKIQDTRYIVVVHDDIDLPLGTVRISVGSGSAGHKGVQSIIEALGTKNFIRIRIGVQPTKEKPENAQNFVLKKFSRDETKTMKQAIEQSCNAIETIINKGVQETMSQYN